MLAIIQKCLGDIKTDHYLWHCIVIIFLVLLIITRASLLVLIFLVKERELKEDFEILSFGIRKLRPEFLENQPLRRIPKK